MERIVFYYDEKMYWCYLEKETNKNQHLINILRNYEKK